MNKKLIAIAVAGALVAPLAAQADVSGFADVVYTATNDANTAAESLFGANGEVDFTGKSGDVGVRVDLNLSDIGSTNLPVSTGIEQAYMSAPLGPVTLWAGVFNSPLTADGYDRPDMAFSTHSAVFNVAANEATVNLAGLAISGMAGPANYTVAFVNDPGSDGTNNTNSFAVVVNGSVMDGLNAELGYFGQSDDTAKYTNASGAGNITDLNLQYMMDAFNVGLDYATAANIVDSVYSIDAGYDMGNGLTIALRYDAAKFASGTATDDPDATTVSIGYAMNDNMSLTLENTSGTNNDTSGTALAATGIADGTVTTLEFLGTF
jgi:hypothetical protein